MRASFRALFSLFLVTAPSVGVAQELTSQQEALAYRWAANNAMFVLLHEVGHLLVDQLHWPILGREEDAADNLATHMLLSMQTPEADQALIDAARGWLLSDKLGGTGFDNSDFYDFHSLDLQRSFAIVCLMVGFNPQTFGAVADTYEIDDGRQESCELDYYQIDNSQRALLSMFGNKNARGTDVEVVYQRAPPYLRIAADAFINSGVFERVADHVRQTYNLGNRVRFTAMSCGEPNAFYDAAEIEIEFCYELMEDYLNMAKFDMRAIEASALAMAASGPLAPAGEKLK